MKKLLILNGPNLNLLGLREPKLYGTQDYAALEAFVHARCAARGLICRVVQSNHEGVLVDAIQDALHDCAGIVFNPAAYTHTSVALLDALLAVGLPTVEVHLTNINRQEPYRRVSYVRSACVGVCMGDGFESYGKAIDLLAERLVPNTTSK